MVCVCSFFPFLNLDTCKSLDAKVTCYTPFLSLSIIYHINVTSAFSSSFNTPLHQCYFLTVKIFLSFVVSRMRPKAKIFQTSNQRCLKVLHLPMNYQSMLYTILHHFLSLKKGIKQWVEWGKRPMWGWIVGHLQVLGMGNILLNENKCSIIYILLRIKQVCYSL